jgi:hypothetical protein
MLQAVLEGAAGSVDERPAIKPFPGEWNFAGKLLVLEVTDEVELRRRVRTRKLEDGRLLTDLCERRERILNKIIVCGKVPGVALLVDNGKERAIAWSTAAQPLRLRSIAAGDVSKGQSMMGGGMTSSRLMRRALASETNGMPMCSAMVAPQYSIWSMTRRSIFSLRMRSGR